MGVRIQELTLCLSLHFSRCLSQAKRRRRLNIFFNAGIRIEIYGFHDTIEKEMTANINSIRSSHLTDKPIGAVADWLDSVMVWGGGARCGRREGFGGGRGGGGGERLGNFKMPPVDCC